MKLDGRNFIGGSRSGGGGRTFCAVDPLQGWPLEPRFFEATRVEIEKAFQAAEEAVAPLAGLAPGDRAGFLRTLAEELFHLGGDLIQRAMAETALPEGRLEGERLRTANQIRMFADLIEEGSWVDARIDRPDTERKPIPKPDLRRMLVPLGPVVIFGSSNFPLAFSVAGGDTVSALAAGNPVVVKAHPAHPGTSELVAGAMLTAVRKCGLPQGTFSMVHGVSHDIGLSLVRHPSVQAVGFTGSLKGGRALFDAAAARPVPIPVFAEMGSINPVFLLPKALEERAVELAESLHASVTLGVGQFCTNPGLVVALEGPELERFVIRLRELTELCKPATMLHGGIRDAYGVGLAELRKQPGVVLLAESSVAPDPAKSEAPAVVLETKATTFLGGTGLAREVFGPSTLLVKCSELDEMYEVANQLKGHLTATIHTGGVACSESLKLVSILEGKAGRVLFNGFPTGVEVCPSMHHGGPYPATTDARSTSVGTAAILRFARPVCYQNFPQEALPLVLRDKNSSGIWRMIDGELTRNDV